MSAEQDRVRQLASRIAERVSRGENLGDAQDPLTDSGELAAVRRSIVELKQKLASIEEHLSHEQNDSSPEMESYGRAETVASKPEGMFERPPISAHSPWLSSSLYVPATHPSQEKFGVEEAAVSELVDFFEKEKVCELEPGGKPCTHCDMCSTRGF